MSLISKVSRNMNTIMLALVADIVGSMLLILMLEAIHFFLEKISKRRKKNKQTRRFQ